MIGPIIFIVLSMVFCVSFCVLRAQKATGFSLTLKILSSLAFIIAGILALQVNGFSTIGILILVGLICGLAGDILLDLKIMYPQHNNAYFYFPTTEMTSAERAEYEAIKEEYKNNVGY